MNENRKCLFFNCYCAGPRILQVEKIIFYFAISYLLYLSTYNLEINT